MQHKQFLNKIYSGIKPAYIVAVTLIFAIVFLSSGCSDDSKQKINVPASEIIISIENDISDINTNELLSYTDKTYDTNFPTLYNNLDTSDITDGAISYDSTGETSDEISILVAKDKESTKTLRNSLKSRAEKRSRDFGGYKPEEASKAENANIITCDRYVMMAICEDSAEAQKKFQILMQEYAQKSRDS